MRERIQVDSYTVKQRGEDIFGNGVFSQFVNFNAVLDVNVFSVVVFEGYVLVVSCFGACNTGKEIVHNIVHLHFIRVTFLPF